jgi:pilus assembly protein Flp/PilA
MNKLYSALNTLVLKATGIVPMVRVEDEEGQTLVEYGLILALIAIVCVGALTFLKGQITGVFSNVGSSL